VRVALTFDAEHPDRPHRAGVADEIVALLAAERVRATFFLQGRWTTAHPHTATRIARDGHLVGSHSFSHARMPALSPEGMRSDVRAAEQTIFQIAGADPRPWFRCPYGAGWCDPGVRSVLHELGYRHVGWDVVVEDWEPKRDGKAVAEGVLDGVARSNGEAVVLLHTWPQATLEALPEIIGQLRRDGGELVGVDELERVPEEAAPC
jgi:peptidoglycan/xylan/chitin deacetylase (PgdA/CDA1 family)